MEKLSLKKFIPLSSSLAKRIVGGNTRPTNQAGATWVFVGSQQTLVGGNDDPEYDWIMHEE